MVCFPRLFKCCRYSSKQNVVDCFPQDKITMKQTKMTREDSEFRKIFFSRCFLPLTIFHFQLSDIIGLHSTLYFSTQLQPLTKFFCFDYFLYYKRYEETVVLYLETYLTHNLSLAAVLTQRIIWILILLFVLLKSIVVVVSDLVVNIIICC